MSQASNASTKNARRTSSSSSMPPGTDSSDDGHEQPTGRAATLKSAIGAWGNELSDLSESSGPAEDPGFHCGWVGGQLRMIEPCCSLVPNSCVGDAC